MLQPALSLDNICYSTGESQILSEVTLHIHTGERVGLIGPNGSGKTSLFNIVSGFATAKQGHCSLHGEDITALSPFRRARRGLGRVFQQTGIFREMTVEENIFVAMDKGFLLHSLSRRELRRRSTELLDRVGLIPKARSRAASLSGGQMRLLEIVRAIAGGASFLLLDEPTAGVSPKMQEEVLSLMHALSEEGKTIVVIEHDIAFLRAWCERVIVLHQGRIGLDGPTQEVEENPLLREIYLGSRQSVTVTAAAR